MQSSLNFRIYRQADELPENWDVIAGKNTFLSQAYLNVLNDSAPGNMQCFFIGIFNGEKLSGIAVSQFLDLSDVSSFGERDNCIKNKIRTFVFKRFAAHVLIVGNNMLTGQNTCAFSSEIDPTEGIECLAHAVKEIKGQIHKRIHLTIWKDFPEDKLNYFNPSIFENYFRFSTQPNMVLEIKKNWTSFDDYLVDLLKKYRDQYKRARKKSDGIQKKRMLLPEIIAYQSKIHELYLTVARNAPFNTFYLDEKHFISLKEMLGENFLFYGYFMENELIGFNTLIKNGDDVDTYFLGYDEQHQKQNMLYLNMLYDMTAYSINQGYHRIIFARTALEIKSSIGAKPIKLYGYIKHRNAFINLFMPRLFGFFEPDVPWQERHPFKG